MKMQVLAALCLLLALLGCTRDGTGPAGEGTLVVSNACAFPIATVNFSPCSESAWGDNRLGAGETIQVGAERGWPTSSGCYNVRVQAPDRSPVEFRSITVQQGDTTRVLVRSL